MTWTPLAQRFDALPFILAGPLLRRTEPASVTVWLAVKEACQVTLRIYRRGAEDKLVPQFEGTRNTVRLGDHLHLVAVTAATNQTEEQLQWGQHYYYDLFFLPEDAPLTADAAHLAMPGIYTAAHSQADPIQSLVYHGHPLPGFVLPPEDLNQLRVIHGSCRKLHGNGRDMLSAVDALLTRSLHDASDYPHQLFLTGDQIYADDVSPVALFALMDVGQFLFTGNEEEILPLIQTPARTLAPGSRTEIIRNKALLTTTHPHNHLLALHEYAAMYLFAWSDILWPDDLPNAAEVWQAYPDVRPGPADQKKAEALYHVDEEKLTDFRSRLPLIRRAMANIPTYMICDDHEITDDWYLDGKWYQQVLTNPLGRRIVRNGLLTYALFQAWGNTPAQFADTQGAALLNALHAWRGQETANWTQTIEPLLGLPQITVAPLSIPPQALQWHYTYNGPRYQVVVMDTRTRRLYRSPDAFPGLLSPSAMENQLSPATRRDAEVTIIISATPLLGVDLIESMQFWSHWRVRENYAYDREAWSLDWGTFQHLLKTVSDLKRVLFLSGDVHYAFGASLQYWDLHRQMSARIIDYTSSPLCNEGSGAQLAILAVVYPQIQQLFHRDGDSGQSFFAWDIPTGDHSTLNALLPLIRQRLYLFWWAIPRLLAAHRSLDEIVMPSHGWLKGTFHDHPPDRSYHLHYLRNNLTERAPEHRLSLTRQLAQGKILLSRFALQALTWLEGSVQSIRKRLLRQIPKIAKQPEGIAHPTRSLVNTTLRRTERAERHLERRRDRLVVRIFQSVLRQNRWKAGNMIIGSNNIAEIRFRWTPEEHEVMQFLWWYDGEQENILRVAQYRDTLEPPALDSAPPLP